ncbi:MAG: molybdopterin-dependent oxidoreductase [Chloroflexi bacterium]|nr:molybdopterin-dependent oxidoreductase [Chloroflexota bacterium]
MQAPPDADHRAEPGISAAPDSAAGRAAFVGVVATGAAVAIGEFLAGVVPGVPSPILSVGQQLIDLQPPGAKEFVVSLFGTADKLALEIIVLVVALGIGALVGLIGRSQPARAMGIIAAFVAIGVASSLRDPETVLTLAVGSGLAEFAVGATILDRLLAVARGDDGRSPTTHATMPDWSRRSLLIRGGLVAVGSVAASAFGRSLLARQRQTTPGAVPVAEDQVSLPTGADLSIPGLTPIVVPNADFYRIDTALIPPNVDRTTWQLRIHGMVDREVTLTYDQLIELPVIEQYVTIACVSNRVGGDLVGNAKWTGVRLRDVLDMAGVQTGATQMVGRSVDGWTAGSPTAWVMDPEREPMIALGMNGAPLPREHGYPARVIVPGLFGYVSATKWVTELEFTTLEAFDAYWVPLGWAKEAPILTQSRIDVPVRNTQVPAGPMKLAGVAWAPDRGVASVEVSIDDDVFREATLSVPISNATWVQWEFPWIATSGSHRARVRATDSTGETQTETATRPDPNGARGWHTISFIVA